MGNNIQGELTMHFESYEEFRSWLKANPETKEVDEDE